MRLRFAAMLALLAASACAETEDSIGHNGPGGIPLRPMTGPASYPNPFRDLLGHTDAAINARIAAVFDQLFYGDPAMQAIYVPFDADKAYIHDVNHDDIRTEGLGLAMMVTLQLDKRAEFDRLWRYAKAMLRLTSGPAAGYFRSFCDTQAGTISCLDPYGHQQFVMALLLAWQRWSSAPGAIDYGADALALMDVMRHKEDANGGIIDGVTNMFDPEARLVQDIPAVTSENRGRPAIVMPAYYEMWAQATGDPFWRKAAESARGYWERTAHPETGLMPLRAAFDGEAALGGEFFQAEGYRAQINIVLDAIWAGAGDWHGQEAERLLRFFSRQGFQTYGRIYTLDGQVIDIMHDPALVVVNGVTAMIANVPDKRAYIEEVWALKTPEGQYRYYTGILELVALLILSGQFRIP